VLDKQATPEPSARNTLGVEGAAYTRLLERLDEVGAESMCASPSRVFRRLSYTQPRVRLAVEHEGHSHRDIVVATRNLSQGGVSILHSNFMHTGTGVRIELVRTDGLRHDARGRVARCAHRGGVLHEIGIAFDKEIHLRHYLSPNAETLVYTRERIDPAQLDLRLAVCSGSPEVSAILRQYFLSTNLVTRFVTNIGGLREALRDRDLVVCHDSASAPGVEAVRAARDTGYRGPIVLIGSANSEADACVMHACGADMILPEPIHEPTLMCAIGEYVYNDWTPEALETVRMCVDPRGAALLCDEIRRMGERLELAGRNNDGRNAESVCARIARIAPAVRMDAVARAAQDERAQIEAHGMSAPVRERLAELASVCRAFERRAA